MKIVFTSKGKEWDSNIDPKFGRTENLFFYDEEKDKVEVYDNSAVSRTAHGAGPQTSQEVINRDAQVLITGNGPGGNAGRVLRSAGIEIFAGAGDMTLRQAYDAYKKNKLTKF